MSWRGLFEKAKLLNCPVDKSGVTKEIPTYGIVLIVILGVLVSLLIVGIGHMTMREKAGHPVFMPLPQAEATAHVGAADGKEQKEQKEEQPVKLEIVNDGNGDAEADRSCFSRTAC